MEDKLIFIVGSPRSGSTLLSRMLGSHPTVFSPAEPHLLTPLAHLGYYANVDKAPYDPFITQGAIREVVAKLPGGEPDYLRALRAYADAIYGRLLEASGRAMLLDKTPAYALVLDFVAKLYPNSRYVVLTRQPIAVWSSYVQSFFDGDHEAAHLHNPLLERYVPAIARFLREPPVPQCHVRYEDLVSRPADEMQRICAFAGLDFEPEMVEYGSGDDGRGQAARGLGDPITVAREKRPTTRSVERWAQDMAGDPGKVEQAQRILASLTDEDIETWGYARTDIAAALVAVDTGAARRKPGALTRHRIERKLLVFLRRNIHRNAFGRLVRRIRFACDVLLR
ncbi:MAG: sulfotransferase [Myxococcales bacterium]|nr:sulfotransferase [Myxococcales bacterium]